MGYNPYRQRVSRRSDLWFVLVAVAVILGVVAWAVFPALNDGTRMDIGIGRDVEVQVTHVQPYQAVKSYRCPGCDHMIEPGLGHEVVVPVDAPDLRRHWHSGCWQQAARERARAAQRRRGDS